jgi:hypothetical protein
VAPLVVVLASLLQFLLAATFLILPAVGRLRGPDAQRAAEADVARQDFPVAVLAQRRIDFGASRASVVLAVAIGLCFATLGALDLAGSEVGRTLSWICQPIILVLGAVIMPGEVFTVRYVESAFEKSGDPALRGIDVKAFVDAARGAYPGWFGFVVAARLALATVGSLLVIVLLAVPQASAYFR